MLLFGLLARLCNDVYRRPMAIVRAACGAGLVEFIAELQSIPDVEVVTYWHPEWSSLVDDINRQPEGTHILVIGYSLGANNSVLVANNSNFIDSIIALQPSIFTSNTPLTGRVGRIVEIYNPNPWMTFWWNGITEASGAKYRIHHE